MKVPFLDLKPGVSAIRADVERRFSDIIDRTAFVCGQNVSEFEQSFAEMHGVDHAVGLSSGTDGNHLAMLCCDIKPGDEVLVPVNTFIATAEGVSHAGATPVFVDVDEQSFNVDPKKMEAAITDRTRAVCPVHLFGQPADMDVIQEVAQRHGLHVIEDAAQAHLASYKGRSVGGLGSVASWSFYPGKNLGAWGEAGALTTNDQNICDKARKLRDHGSGRKYYHDFIGHNYRMAEFQGAVLAEKLKHIERWTDMRRVNAQRYNERLKSIDAVQIPVENDGCKHVYHLYVIRTSQRDALQVALREKDIATGLHYPIPLHLTDAYSHQGHAAGDFPVAERIAAEMLSLPMYPDLSEAQIDYVCEQIESFFAL